MAKPKGKLDFLTDQQFEALKGWLWGGMTNQKAVEQLFVEFGIKTSTRAVGEFWTEYVEPPFLEQRRGAARLAEAVRKEALSRPTDFDSAAVDRLSELSFILAERAAANPISKERDRLTQDAKTLITLVLKKRSQESKDKALQLDMEKFRAGLLKKTELAMQELYNEIKDNPAALAAFEKMKEAMASK